MADEKGRRRQPSTFSDQQAQGRPKSDESFGTTRRKFLNAALPTTEQDSEKLHHVNFVPTSNKSPGGKERKKKKKKKTEKKESFDPSNDDREEQRLRELKEWMNLDTDKSHIYHELKIAMLKHMRVLDDLERLKAHFYVEYMEALKDKVEDQRVDIQQRSEAQQRKLLRRERKQREAARKANILMHRPDVSTDNSFLRKLSKTRYHKIIVLQDQLIREGKLRRDEDMRAFWEDVANPENYPELLEDDEQTGDGESLSRTKTTRRDGEIGTEDHESQASAPDSVPEDKSSSLGSLHHVDPMMTSLAQIQEVREPSRPNSMGGPDVHSWMNVPKLKKRLSLPISRKPVHPKVLEMEQRCPKVDFPKLAAFTLDLEPPKEDPEIELMREEFQTRARVRNSEKRRLRKMYQSSLSNGAATKRIIDKSGEINKILSGPSLGDVLYGEEPIPTLAYPQREEEEEEERLALPAPFILASSQERGHHGNVAPGSSPERILRSLAMERISEEGDDGNEDCHDDDDDDEEEGTKYLTYSSRSSSRRSSLTSTESERRRNTPVMVAPRRPQPLTLNAVIEKCDVKIATGPSALWINYGKFLPAVK
ncbi:uncharacterized protein [Diadema antillarum]|uniref:uncharacterized protein n=1 Tax=Diadema antillarum TaxID=105358 RepID=UPI003A862850